MTVSHLLFCSTTLPISPSLLLISLFTDLNQVSQVSQSVCQSVNQSIRSFRSARSVTQVSQVSQHDGNVTNVENVTIVTINISSIGATYLQGVNITNMSATYFQPINIWNIQHHMHFCKYFQPINISNIQILPVSYILDVLVTQFEGITITPPPVFIENFSGRKNICCLLFREGVGGSWQSEPLVHFFSFLFFFL